MSRERSYIVRLTVPDLATNVDVIAYIDDAIRSWRGQTRPPLSYSDNDPGDPMWELDPETVKVRRDR